MRKKKRKKRLPRTASLPRFATGCCLGGTRTGFRILRTAWCHHGYSCMLWFWRPWKKSTHPPRGGGARAIRRWKPGLSAHTWYLAPTCSVPVSPEEHRYMGVFWETTTRIYFNGPLNLTVTCSLLVSTGKCTVLGDDFRKCSLFVVCSVRRRIHVYFKVRKRLKNSKFGYVEVDLGSRGRCLVLLTPGILDITSAGPLYLAFMCQTTVATEEFLHFLREGELGVGTLESGSHQFGDCLARGVQVHLDFLGDDVTNIFLKNNAQLGPTVDTAPASVYGGILE